MDQWTQTLQAWIGHRRFRPGQREALEVLSQKRDCLALLPTGAGKSLIYQLYARVSERPVLVISPLIALMEDQRREARAQGLRAACYHSQLEECERWRVREQLQKNELKLLFMAPEAVWRDWVAELPWALIVVDEAHCALEWGDQFRPAYQKLFQLRELIHAPLLALTATLEKRELPLLKRRLGLRDAEIIRVDLLRRNLGFRVEWSLSLNKRVISYVRKRVGESGAGLVYVRRRVDVDQLVGQLRAEGIECFAYHAGMKREERSVILQEFQKRQHIILVATVAFGMGINRADVRWVCHQGAPLRLTQYLQEAGRAGRDGVISEAVMIEGPFQLLQKMTRLGRNELVAQWRMMGYLLTRSCRQKVLLNALAEKGIARCGQCDRCQTRRNQKSVLTKIDEIWCRSFSKLGALSTRLTSSSR